MHLAQTTFYSKYLLMSFSLYLLQSSSEGVGGRDQSSHVTGEGAEVSPRVTEAR